MSPANPSDKEHESSTSPPQPGPSGHQRKEKLKRSKDGCFNCRSRKKKCDLQRPICASCERLGLDECTWPVMGKDEKGRLVVVNRPPKRIKPNPPASNDSGEAQNISVGQQANVSGGASGSHSGQGQWPTRSTSPPRPNKRPLSMAAPAQPRMSNGGLRMEDWASSLGRLGMIAAPPPAADSPLVAQETDDLLNFLLPQYQRSVQAAQASQSAPLDGTAAQQDAGSFLNSAMFQPHAFQPPTTQTHHLPSSAFLAPQHPSPEVHSNPIASSSNVHQPPLSLPMLAPSPATHMSPWFEDALNGTSPRTFAQSFSMAGLSPAVTPNLQNAQPHDLSGFLQHDWLVSSPRPETGNSTINTRTPAQAPNSLHSLPPQSTPVLSQASIYQPSGSLETNGGPSNGSEPVLPGPSTSSNLRKRKPGDSPENPIVPLLSTSNVKSTLARQTFDHPPEPAFPGGTFVGEDFEFDFGTDDVSDEEPMDEGEVDGEISRSSIDGQRNLAANNPSIGPKISIPLPELPAFIATQAPLLIDYFLRKLAPLVSVLTPDPQSVSALSMAVSAGAGMLGVRGGLERRAGNDLASCFLPMALESDSLLVGIVAWSSTHLSDVGQPWRDIAERLTKDATSRADKAFKEWESNKLVLGADADREAEKLLGTLILLSEVEICKGSTEGWYSPLMMAQKVLQRLGGSKGLSRLSWNGKWLMQNYVYHELTSSELPLNGPVFDEETYRAVLEGGLNTFMGSTMPIFQILSDIARLSPSLSSVLSDTATDEDPKKRIESFLALSSKIQLLEARLDACYPTFHASEGGNGSGTAPYHFAAFRCYSITARLYLKQIVLHSNARSIANQTLVAQALESIKAVQSTPFESSLLFPIFVAGVDCVTTRDRDEIRTLFEGLHSTCRIGNIQTAYLLLQEIWARNDNGERWINWSSLARELGWHVSFA